MAKIEDNSVDMILCDLPYGVTANKWDTIIPFESLWKQYNRVIKPNGAICLFAQGLFSARLMLSNEKMYKYKWVWNKNNSAGFANAKIMPFQICEDILVFGNGRVNYYPIMDERGKPRLKGGYSASTNYFIEPSQDKNNLYYPKHLLNFSNASQKNKLHPTQKPVELCGYLINTYTKQGETVLDNCMGSGTTAVAAINTNRNYIGFEFDTTYCDIANKRIQDIVKK